MIKVLSLAFLFVSVHLIACDIRDRFTKEMYVDLYYGKLCIVSEGHVYFIEKISHHPKCTCDSPNRAEILSDGSIWLDPND